MHFVSIHKQLPINATPLHLITCAINDIHGDFVKLSAILEEASGVRDKSVRSKSIQLRGCSYFMRRFVAVFLICPSLALLGGFGA